MFRDRVTVRREDLYTQVWAKPMSSVCKEFHISDTGLKKICKKYNIPTPPLGHWAKKQYGKKVHQPRLPEMKESWQETIVFYALRDAPELRALSPEAQTSVSFEKQTENQITVADRLVEPHPLVSTTEVALKSAKVGVQGLVRPKPKGCLSVAVAPANIDRAMRILDALLKALDQRGYAGRVTTDRSTTVKVLNETLTINLEESVDARQKAISPAEQKRREKEWWIRHEPEYDYFPTGQLSLWIGGGCGSGYRRTWSDASKQRLEQCLNSFVAGLAKVAEKSKLARAAEKQRQREREEQERRWREEEQKRAEEAERVRELESTLQVWRKVRDMRDLASAYEKLARDCGRTIRPGSEVHQWVSWIRRHADELDPVQIEWITEPDAPE